MLGLLQPARPVLPGARHGARREAVARAFLDLALAERAERAHRHGAALQLGIAAHIDRAEHAFVQRAAGDGVHDVDDLRHAPSVRLRPAARVRFEPAATIEGREVVMRDALVLPGLDAPLRFVAGVDLPALVALARQCGDMSSLIAAYRSRVGAIPVEELLTGLSLLVARHALITINEDSSV